MMRIRNMFSEFTKLEMTILITSVVVIIASFILTGANDVLTFLSSLFGAVALIFIAKGYIFGLIVSICFSILYSIISFSYKYYGEAITYVFMIIPVDIFSLVTWKMNKKDNQKEVTIGKLNSKKIALISILAIIVTTIFYFVLKALDNTNLLMSTVSITTSFLAGILTLFRSPYYGLAYAANDLVLIVLWLLATIKDPGYLPMFLCFVVFLINDLYGFYNWNRLRKIQSANIVYDQQTLANQEL